MYYIRKTLEISAAHQLSLSYASKCSRLHGHNWNVTIYCRAEQLDGNGMVTDFGHVKEQIHGQLDHQNINDVLPFNPTAENLARWIVDTIPECYCAKVEESRNNVAIYTLDDKAPIF